MPIKSARRLRILHVVERMNRGGVEVWLMHILRAINKDRFHMDFLVHSLEPGEFDQEIYGLGSKVLRCPAVKNPLVYAKTFRGILRGQEPYDIIHSHVHHFSGLLVLLAYLGGIPVRIAHSHCDSALVDERGGFLRKMYLRLMKNLIDRFATLGLAASGKAANALQKQRRRQLTWDVILCGIDLSHFSLLSPKVSLRQELDIPDDAIVIGHVGNFVPAKNHAFIMQVAQEFFLRHPNSYLILVGDGDLRGAMEAQAATLGMDHRIRFLGVRQDVPQLLQVMDVFLFPSIFEGLGMVVVEAQATGLPIVISDAVPKEVDVVPGLLHWLSLSLPAAVWAEKCAGAYQEKISTPAAAFNELKRTDFNILNNVQHLQNIYSRERG